MYDERLTLKTSFFAVDGCDNLCMFFLASEMNKHQINELSHENTGFLPVKTKTLLAFFRYCTGQFVSDLVLNLKTSFLV